jgi:hypothetical protein
MTVLRAPDPGPFGKDADEIMRNRGVAALRQLIEAATPAALSADGWVVKLGRLSDLEYDRKRKDLAQELGGIRLSTLDEMRKQGQQTPASDISDTVRARLIAIATEHGLFQDDGGDGFCCIERAGGAQRTLRIEGAAFTDWLLAEYGQRFPEVVNGRKVPGSASASTISDAVRTVLAVARQGDTKQVFLRLGWARDRLWLDMATPEPRLIEVTPTTWSVIVDPPVAMVYSPTAKPLPMPVMASREAVLARLEYFFGFKRSDPRLLLLIGVMMAGLMPRGPYPILLMSGEQGAGKTNRARMIKLALDPTKASVRGRPKSAEDLAISVWRSWLGLFDNLSKLDQDMSDWLCRLSEGAGLPKRKLYSDLDEVLIEAARPIMLTAIPDIAQSGDVIDRAVLIRCDPLPQKIREQVLLDQFEEFRPSLLAYLLDAASCALRNYHAMVDVHDGLRRGDWCAWTEAASEALGLKAGAFTEAYKANQDQAVRMALELDPVAAAVMAYMADKAEIESGVTLLHAQLEEITRRQHTGRLPLDWPSMAHHFSGRLRRVAPMLRRVGFEVEQEHKRTGSVIRLVNNEYLARAGSKVCPEEASRASPASSEFNSEINGDARDACDTPNPQTCDGAREEHPEPDPGNSISLLCSGCGREFPHDPHKRGRRPSRCPSCRRGGAGHDHTHQPEPQRVSADEAVDQVRAGQRCGYCGVRFRPGEQPVSFNGKAYHGDGCIDEARRLAAQEAP